MTAPASLAAVAQVLGQDRQRRSERGAVGHPEEVAVEVRCPSTCAGWCSRSRPGRRRRSPTGAPGAARRCRPWPRRRAATRPRARRSSAMPARVEGQRRGGPGRRDDEEGDETGGAIGGDGGAPARRGAWRRSSSTSTRRRLSLPMPAMRTAFSTDEWVWVGGVGDEAARGAAVVGPTVGRPFASSDHGAQTALEARVLDDAAARPSERKRSGRPSSSTIQSSITLLELGGSRARRPQHPLHPEAGRRPARRGSTGTRVGREVGEEAGVLPVGEAGDDDPVEVGQHGVEGLGLGGRPAPAAWPGSRRVGPASATGELARRARGSRRSSRRARGRGGGTRPASWSRRSDRTGAVHGRRL